MRILEHIDKNLNLNQVDINYSMYKEICNSIFNDIRKIEFTKKGVIGLMIEIHLF